MNVLQRWVELVDIEIVGSRGREEGHRHARGLLQLVDRVEGRKLVHLDLAPAELELTRVLVGHERPRHAVEIRLALLPVEGVPLERDRLADDPLVPHERTGSHGMLVERLPRLAAEVLRDDPVREERDVGDERRPREFEMEDDRARVGRVDALDRGVEIPPAFCLRPRVVDRELDIGRRHRLAVRELDAFA